MSLLISEEIDDVYILPEPSCSCKASVLIPPSKESSLAKGCNEGINNSPLSILIIFPDWKSISSSYWRLPFTSRLSSPKRVIYGKLVALSRSLSGVDLLLIILTSKPSWFI